MVSSLLLPRPSLLLPLPSLLLSRPSLLLPRPSLLLFPPCLLRRSFSFWAWSKPPPVSFSLVLPTAQAVESFRVSDIPPHIARPQYAASGLVEPSSVPKTAVIWSESEVLAIRESCQLARKVLEEVRSLVRPGVTTEQLDEHAREFIIIHNAYPSCLNFNNYPKSISTSVNNVAAHGIPDSRCLSDGDIVTINVTVFLNGFHGDCSDTVAVGQVDEYGLKLIRVTEEAVEKAIGNCNPGRLLCLIGRDIHKHVRKQDCVSIPHFLGHGIGDFFHGPPDIYHCLNNYPGVMVPGMVFTIGPVVGLISTSSR